MSVRTSVQLGINGSRPLGQYASKQVGKDASKQVDKVKCARLVSKWASRQIGEGVSRLEHKRALMAFGRCNYGNMQGCKKAMLLGKHKSRQVYQGSCVQVSMCANISISIMCGGHGKPVDF